MLNLQKETYRNNKIENKKTVSRKNRAGDAFLQVIVDAASASNYILFVPNILIKRFL